MLCTWKTSAPAENVCCSYGKVWVRKHPSVVSKRGQATKTVAQKKDPRMHMAAQIRKVAEKYTYF